MTLIRVVTKAIEDGYEMVMMDGERFSISELLADLEPEGSPAVRVVEAHGERAVWYAEDRVAEPPLFVLSS